MRRYVFLMLVLVMVGVAVYVTYGAHAVPAKRVESFGATAAFSTASPSQTGDSEERVACSGRVVLEFLNDQKEVVYTRSWPLAVWYVPNGPVFRYVRLRVVVNCSGATPVVSGSLRIMRGDDVLINAPLHAVGSDYETIADMELINANAGSPGEYEAVAHVTVKAGGNVVADKTVSVRVYGKPDTHERVRPRPVRLVRYVLGPWTCCSGCCGAEWAPARVVWIYALYSDGSVHALMSEMMCHNTDRVFHVVGVEGSLHVHVGSPPPDIADKCRNMNSEYPVTPS